MNNVFLQAGKSRGEKEKKKKKGYVVLCESIVSQQSVLGVAQEHRK